MAKTIATPKKSDWLYHEIRSQIVNQKLPVGHKLMTDIELIERYQVSRDSIIRAMQKLTSEGYVSRRVGSGTFVSDKIRDGEIAVVGEHQNFAQESTPYWRLMVSHLLDEIKRRYTKWWGKLHFVTENGDGQPLQECDLLDPQIVPNLLGIVTLSSLRLTALDVIQRGIPFVFLGEPQMYHSNTVFFDQKAIVRQAFDHLAQVGCKQVGVLGETGGKIDIPGFFARYADGIRESGLETHPDWMLLSVREESDIYEQSGWELFHRLWRQKKRPDGIFVTDDLVFRGVVRASLELGVRFPEDIRVLTISPLGCPIPYHKPVTVVDQDTRGLAARALDLLETLIHGREPEEHNIVLPVSITKGATT